MSSKDKKKDKFDLEKYIEFDVDKTNDISIKDVDAALKFFTKEITTEIKDFETLNKQLKNEETNQL